MNIFIARIEARVGSAGRPICQADIIGTSTIIPPVVTLDLGETYKINTRAMSILIPAPFPLHSG